MDNLLAQVRVGFSGLAVADSVREAALEGVSLWLEDPAFVAYRPQLVAMIERGRWDQILDGFYQVLPFGTGGRRGSVGIGPNRYNPFTLGSSVQGHAAYLRRLYGEDAELSVVIAYDVRQFHDLGKSLAPGAPNPLVGLRSRDFAEIAAEVYAAADVAVWLPPADKVMSTPELSFAIRMLHASGGLNVSASHNPPDDNGGKFYNNTGGQEVPPRDEQMAAEVTAVRHIERMPLDRARASGQVREIGPEVHEAYLAANLRCSRVSTARSAHVVFTGLHGTGRTTVAEVLDRAGFKLSIEPTQEAFDGAFTNVPFRVPNPEVPQSMDAAVAHAETVGADIVMACDPDADRLGLMARHQGGWRFFTGNEIAVLVAHFVLMHPRTPRPVLMKTEVTTMLLERLARARGARIVGHLLVGFKYIGDGLNQLETRRAFGDLRAELSDFVFGAEESHGVLVTTEVRDKDAAGGALLLAELASLEKDAGRTLVDTLTGLWQEVGFVKNLLRSTVMRGAEGRARIQEIQMRLRAAPMMTLAGRAVTAFHDRQDTTGPFGPILSGTDLASRDVLVWEIGDEARVILRPSGTEPKNKIYVEMVGRPGADLAAEMARVEAACADLADDFARQMLALVGVELPRWALSVSDLVPVELKVRFAQEIVPALVDRLVRGEESSVWVDHELERFGKDARGLVAPAIWAYVTEVQPACAPALLALFPRR